MLLEFIWLTLSTNEQIPLVLPAITLINVYGWFLMALWRRQCALPLLDIGLFSMTTYLCYTLFPILGFLLSDIQFTELSAVQLYYHKPMAGDLAEVAWRYVLFVASFAIAHRYVRGSKIAQTAISAPSRPMIYSILIAYIALGMFFQGLKYAYNVDFTGAYDDNLLERYNNFLSLPLALRQIAQNLFGSKVVIEIALVLLLVANWKSNRAKYFLFAWLGFIVVSNLMAPGSRTNAILPFLALVLIYDRLVRPISLIQAIHYGILGLLAIGLIGTLRGADPLSFLPEIINLENLTELRIRFFSQSTEFQTVFAGTYDFYVMKYEGLLESIPWQVFISELLAIVPAQLLPFEKVDPQEWYSGMSSTPSYFFFNPICQSIAGFDWFELIARGAMLGWLFGLLHNWYIKNNNSFWVSVLYIYLTIFSFYTIRSTTFGLISWILFKFAPALLIVFVCKILLFPRGSRKSRVTQDIERAI
jgi:hypothetical protein